MKLLTTIIFLFVAIQILAQQSSDKMFAYAATGLKLRSGPSMDSEMITKIKYGDSVIVINDETKTKTLKIDGLKGAFVKVRYNDTIGFVYSGYLSHFKAPKFTERWIEINDYLIQTYGKQSKKTLKREPHPYDSTKLYFGLQFSPEIEYYDFGSDCGANERLVVKGLSVQEAFLFLSTFNWNYRQLSLGGEFNYNKEWNSYSSDRAPLKGQYARGISFQLDKSGNYKLIDMYFDCEAGSGTARIIKGKNESVVIEFSYSCS